MCLTVLTDAVCCAGCTICQGCCSCFKSICGATFKQQIKLTYLIIMVIAMIFTIIVLYYASYILDPFTDFIHCSDQTGGKWACLGVSSVYRMSLSLAVVHFLILLACLTKSEFSKQVNEGCWCLKVLLIFVIWILFFFIPNSFFEGYSDFAKFIGALFLLFQIVMLVDLAYMWGENWIEKYENDQKVYGLFLIIGTGICDTVVILLNVYMFIWYSPDSSCSLTIFLGVFNLIWIVILHILTLSGIAKNGSLLTCSSFSLYITYILWSGMSSNPDASCNDLIFNKNTMVLEIVFGFLLIILSLTYMVFNTNKRSAKRLPIMRGKDINSNIILDEGGDEEKSPSNQNQQHEELFQNREKNVEDSMKPYLTNIYVAFHGIMTVGSIYISMLLTNWGSPNINDTRLNKFEPSNTSFWLQVVASWIAVLVYIWTIVAQKVFPERDFYDDN